MVVSPGFTLVSVVVVFGTLVVVVITLGFEVTTVVSLLVVVAGIPMVETVVGPAVTTSGGCVVD